MKAWRRSSRSARRSSRGADRVIQLARRHRDHPGDPPLHRQSDPRRRSSRRSSLAASRAPSGSNRQPFRFLVLRDGPKAIEAKKLLGEAFRAGWTVKVWRATATRAALAATSSHPSRAHRTHDAALCRPLRTDTGRRARLPRPLPRRSTTTEGSGWTRPPRTSSFAARALGYGGALTGWHTSRRRRTPRAPRHPRRHRAEARRSRSDDRKATTDRFADGRSENSSTTTGGASRRPGRSTRPMPGSPQPGRRRGSRHASSALFFSTVQKR